PWRRSPPCRRGSSGSRIGWARSRRARSPTSPSKPASPSRRRAGGRRGGSTAGKSRYPRRRSRRMALTPAPPRPAREATPPTPGTEAAAGEEKPLATDIRPLPAREGGPLAQPRAVVVRGATIWTEGPSGTVENADLLVVDGRIAAVGKNLSAPAGAVEIDGHGKHVTPGIIDAHSHTAIDGEVNEFTHTVTAEVRIKDVLDPLDVAIYRELAGGTTAANVLHGSANAIGGQTLITKWHWGGGPDDLVFPGAP